MKTETELQRAAQRVRVARTMAAAFPGDGNVRELADALQDFDRIKKETEAKKHV